MKIVIISVFFNIFFLASLTMQAQPNSSYGRGQKTKQLFLDVHQLEPGKIKFEDAAKAHAKDLAVQEKYGVNFLKYWVNADHGLIYCLVSAVDSESIRKAHAEAHGLLPARIYPVTDGEEASFTGKKNLYLDVHELGAGKVTAKAVAEAHKKDLAVQKKYAVNLINYWVDEKSGTIMCLAEAKDSTSLIKTHKEAHGLLPVKVMKVKQGQ